MPYHWILFDADNTLFDFDRAERYALETALEEEGIAFEEAYMDRYHRINKACWREFEEGKLDPPTLRLRRFELFFSELGVSVPSAKFSAQYLTLLGETSFTIPGAHELLEQLRNTHRLALVTNGLKEVQRPRLTRSGLEPFFDVVVVSDEIGYSKPGAAFFDYTFEQMGRPSRSQAVIVGDSLSSDIRGGNDYGVDTCWYNPRQLDNESDIEPTYEIHRLDSLPAILE